MATIEVSDRTKKRIDQYLDGRYKDAGIDAMLEQALDDMDANDTFWDESDARIIQILAEG